MGSAAFLCVVAYTVGTAVGAYFEPSPVWLILPVGSLVLGPLSPFGPKPWRARHVVAVMAVSAGAMYAASARDASLRTPLRLALEARYPGFSIERLGPPPRHDPVVARVRLSEDAVVQDAFTSFRAEVLCLTFDEQCGHAAGGVVVTVSGAEARRLASTWVAGRVLELPLTFRRPARFLDQGVPDFERDQALRGTTLFAQCKSGLVVRTVARGTPREEWAAGVRAHVRRSVGRWAGARSAMTGAIVTAVLIGDRSALPDEQRERLQAAGTYHVLAISGGNIAMLVALVLVVSRLLGLAGRAVPVLTLILLLAYASVVTAGASVWRATLMAALYMAARLIDQQTPPRHALAIVAAVIVWVRPLEVRDVGFLLTCGATAALLAAAHWLMTMKRTWMVWVVSPFAASLAVDLVLLPVNAWAFSRVTAAGLLLNVLAVPLAAIVQMGGIAIVLLDSMPWAAERAASIAHHAARLMVESAQLVEVAPWLVARVPPPPAALTGLYYLALAAALVGRLQLRAAGVGLVVAAGLAIVTGGPTSTAPPAGLRLTMFDVGQGESLLIETAEGASLLVDAGGAPAGSGRFDVGARVVAPALWAGGRRRLDALLITHGHPDHLDGAVSLLSDFKPRRLWTGIRVAGHPGLARLDAAARRGGATRGTWLRDDTIRLGSASVRVLHPEAPDWERSEVRNDDSVVLEVVYHDVVLLLTGDIGAAAERRILPRLHHGAIRVLKVGHHGSRTSTTQTLIDSWRPQIALVSAGRGNTFGHPAAEVIDRLTRAGTAIYRTDRDGQITLDTDGRQLTMRTFMGGKE